MSTRSKIRFHPDGYHETAHQSAKTHDGKITPHTPAWLALLGTINPRQARFALAVIERATRTDCCSICGDMPAPIYDDLDPPHLPVRLCDHCRHMQTGMYQARLVRRMEPVA